MTDSVIIPQPRDIILSEKQAVVISERVDRWLLTKGQQGPQGPAGAAGFSNGSTHIEFQWNNIATLPISVVTHSKLVIHCSIIITIPFNGAGASLQLGDAGNIGRLMGVAAVDPSAVAEYSVSPQVEYGSDTQINLTMNAGAGATQGAGLVVIEVQA